MHFFIHIDLHTLSIIKSFIPFHITLSSAEIINKIIFFKVPNNSCIFSNVIPSKKIKLKNPKFDYDRSSYFKFKDSYNNFTLQ